MLKENKKYQTAKKGNKEAGEFLASAGRSNPFSVPEGYFDQLHDRIMEKTGASRTVRFSVEHPHFIFRHKALAMAVAAGILLIIAWAVFVPGNVEKKDLIPEVSLQQLLNEKPEYIEDIDEDLLIETLLAGNENALVNFNFDQNIDADSSIKDEYILDYMIEEEMSDDFYKNL